ncbi:MAG: Uma2 family endonuclease [Verrucomicrobiae bacterium]|nr:Uma2 family endonuclease [Verrucomicrobiae bacterium]
MNALLEQVMELPTLPEFVAELDARLGAERERRRRFYEAHGVGEYWLVDPLSEMLDQYLLGEGGCALEMKSRTGLI